MFATSHNSASAAGCIWASFVVNLLLGPVASVPIPTTVVTLDVELIYRNACIELVSPDGLCAPITLLDHRWASDHFIHTCHTVVRCTKNFLRFDVVTFSAPYTWTSIEAQIIGIIWSCNSCYSLANCLSTLAFADFEIFCTQKALFFLQNRFSASSSAVRDRSEWFCWLTSVENVHDSRTAPITISSEAASIAVFLSLLELSRIDVQCTAGILILPLITFRCQEMLVNESNGLE